jgi:nicotinamidase-related amidase
MGVHSVVVCGLTTAVCVSQTARELADLGFQVIVAEDGCTELSDESHRAALFTFALTFGRVRPTRQIARRRTRKCVRDRICVTVQPFLLGLTW